MIMLCLFYIGDNFKSYNQQKGFNINHMNLYNLINNIYGCFLSLAHNYCDL